MKRRPRPGQVRRRWRAATRWLLALGASLAAGIGLALLAGAGLPKHATVKLIAQASPTPAAEASPAPPPQPTQFALLPDAAAVPRPGRPDRLVIPSIHLDSSVVPVGTVMQDGVLQWDTAAFAVGYYLGTGLPGERGNVVLAGHISSPLSHKGDVFRHLPEVRPGDEVSVYSAGEEWQYRVSEVRIVEPTAVSVMAPTDDATLTLLTCYPDNVYSERFVVIGKLEHGSAAAAAHTGSAGGS